MATFRRIRKASPSIISHTFDTYNEAVKFCNLVAVMGPSKPFKKGSQWAVSMVNKAPTKGEIAKVDDWHKPGIYDADGKLMYSSYGDWRYVEGLDKLPAHVSEAQIANLVQKAQDIKMNKVGWQPLPKHVYTLA